MEYNGALIKEAIEREMARNGQVYFLYNRVEDIERKADEISMLVPDARIAYAHGQMNENELEAVILSFLAGGMMYWSQRRSLKQAWTSRTSIRSSYSMRTGWAYPSFTS